MVFSPCSEINTQFLWPKRGTRLVDLWTFGAFDFNFDFRLAVSVSRLGFVFGLSLGFGFVWGFLAALYGIFAIMNGPGLGPHSKCQCYCTRAARMSFKPVHLCRGVGSGVCLGVKSLLKVLIFIWIRNNVWKYVCLNLLYAFKNYFHYD